MKKATFKKAGAAVLSMAMLLSFGAIGATSVSAVDPGKYSVTVSDPQNTGVEYQYIKIADATLNNGRYEYRAVQSPFTSILETDTTTKNIKLKHAITLNGTSYAAGTVVSTSNIGDKSAEAHDLAAALLAEAGSASFSAIPDGGLAPGYYLLKDTNTTTTGSQPILLSITNSNKELTAKATKIPFSKTISKITPATTSKSTVADKIATDKKSGVAEANSTVTYNLYTKFPTYDTTNVIANTLYFKADASDKTKWDGTNYTTNAAEAQTVDSEPQVYKYASNITDFTITDIPEDTITIKNNTTATALGSNVKVYINSVDDANLVAASKYTLTANVSNGARAKDTTKNLFTASTADVAGNGFTITFNDDYVISNGGTAVYVVFDATVSGNPDVDTDKNANEATLDYNNNYWTGGSLKNADGTPTTPETPNTEEHDEADVYATYVVVNKQKEDGTSLKDATFNLYSKTDGTKTLVGTYTDNGDGAAPDADTVAFRFSGLAEGVYVIEETHVPSGYSKAGDIEFTVTATNEYASITDTDNPNYGKTKYLGNFTYSDSNGGSTNTINVRNYAGTTLPGTGGMGTILFTVGGSAIVLIAGAMFVLYMKKRRVEE